MSNAFEKTTAAVRQCNVEETSCNENVSNRSQTSKSAMCLINDLTRSSKLTHEYQLLNESGPEHQRNYQVSLELEKLGSFIGNGTSIKKAQQDAANKALESDRVQSVIKSLKNGKPGKNVYKSNTKPSVKLNVLAMKCGESATFTVTDMSTAIEAEKRCTSRSRSTNCPSSRDEVSPTYLACVNVCGRDFEGVGLTPQGARHSAAQIALNYCQANNLLSPTSSPQTESSQMSAKQSVSIDAKDSKSPVSILHDYATANDLLMSFEVVSGSGPNHLPSFVTKCTLGDHKVEGTGTSKRLSKRNAAEKMLLLVQSLESLNLHDDSSINDQSSVSGEDNSAAGDDTGFSSLSTSASEDEVKSSNEENEDEVFIEVRRGKRRNQQQKVTQVQCQSISKEEEEAEDERSASSLSAGDNVLVTDEDDDDDEDKASTITTSTTVSKSSASSAPDPVRRLHQYCASYKGDVPKYRMIYERYVNHKRREFVIECTAKMPGPKGEIAYVVGIDANPKLAKKRAAENMLRLLTTGKAIDDIKIPPRSKLAPILKDTTHSANQADDDARPPARARRQRQVSFSDSNPRNHKRGKKDS